MFRNDIPGSEPKPAWQILKELSDAMSSISKISINDLWDSLAKENPIFRNLKSADSSEDIRFIPDQSNGNLFSLEWLKKLENPPFSVDSLELLPVEWTFGTEELSGYSPHVQQVEKAPCLFMHPKDAARAGLKNKDKVTLHLDGGPLEIELFIREDMASGVMVLPRHRQLQWQKLKEYPVRVTFDRIRKSQRMTNSL
jgi:NADH-quinone oxidoreductase subunit G